MTAPASYVNAGVAAHADYAAVTAPLPTGMATGDVVYLFAVCRGLTTSLAITSAGASSWELLADFGHAKLWGRIYDNVFGDPTVTPSGGAAGDTVSAQTFAARGSSLILDRANSHTHDTAVVNIEFPGIVPYTDGCTVVRIGWRQDDWASVAALSGATQIGAPFSSLGNDQGFVWDVQFQDERTGVPQGSFAVTGGSAAVSFGAVLAFLPESGLDDAVGMSGRLWMPPRLRTDWAGDGYDGDRTIDDLGRQLGGGWSVTHHLDDGLPDEVSFVAGLGTPTLAATLGGAPEASGPGMSARAYFSPLRTDSPIYGYARDVAPLTFDVGAVTSTGPEYARIFTGQMTDAPLKGAAAALTGISRSRLLLSALVQPPAVAGRYEGARADWVVSYALAASGVYLSPPPQTGCRLWLPMHGSVHPFIPDDNLDAVRGFYVNGGIGHDNSVWRDGPFHTAADFAWAPSDGSGGLASNRDYNQQVGKATPLGDGEDMATQTSLRGKLEMWIYGYEYDFNDFPSASAGIVTWARWQQNNANGTGVDMGLRATATSTDRKAYINVTYSTGLTVSMNSATAVPKDGRWHFLGLAYDFTGANHKRWMNLDGIVETDNTSIPLSGFPATEAYSTGYPRFTCIWPVAEVQVTAGAYANPDSHPWLLDIPFTPGARMTPSLIDLVNVAETEPREAWELIGSFARAELAMLRTDEHDTVEYLNPGWWVRDAQQVVADSLDTAHNIEPVPVIQDPTKIRNSIRVTYDLAQSSTLYTIVGTYSSELGFPPGMTTFVLPLSTTAVELRGLTVALNDASGTQPTDTTYATLNTAADGSGSYADGSQATVTITSWHPGAATIMLDNRTGAFLYFANDASWPGLGIAGKPHLTLQTFAWDGDETSIAERGERSLPVAAGAVQREYDARRLARNLKTSLMQPVIVIGDNTNGIAAAGDPRRRPGMLTRVRDAETGIDDTLWRMQSVGHAGDKGSYRNDITVRRTLPILVVGQGAVGYTLIGPNSRTVDPELSS